MRGLDNDPSPMRRMDSSTRQECEQVRIMSSRLWGGTMFHGKGGYAPRRSRAVYAHLVNTGRFVPTFLLLSLVAPVEAASVGATPE